MITELSDEAKAARRKIRKVYEQAYTLFLDKLEVVPTPAHFPLPYGICEEVRQAPWPHLPLIDQMVSWDLSETINQLNAWAEWLLHLSIWTEVLDNFDEQDAWTLQHHYVDPLAQVCLIEPSATRDRFGHIATHAIHQANLCTLDGYRDHLKQDDRKYPLSRKQVEEQIVEIGALWKGTQPFLEALKNLDTDGYHQATRNYRNLASHAIAPRFRFGYTNMVVRSIRPATEQVQQPDGSYLFVEHPTKKAVSYGFGGTDALDLREVHRLSQTQFDQAVSVFNAYRALMGEMLSALRAKAPPQQPLTSESKGHP